MVNIKEQIKNLVAAKDGEIVEASARLRELRAAREAYMITLDKIESAERQAIKDSLPKN